MFETKAVEELTDDRVLKTASFVKDIGRATAGAYFLTIGVTKDVEALTNESVLNFVSFVILQRM